MWVAKVRSVREKIRELGATPLFVKNRRGTWVSREGACPLWVPLATAL